MIRSSLLRNTAPLITAIAVVGGSFALYSASSRGVEHGGARVSSKLSTSFQASATTGPSTAEGQSAPSTAIPPVPASLRSLIVSTAPNGFSDVTSASARVGLVDPNELVFAGAAGQVQVYESIVAGGASWPPGDVGPHTALGSGGAMASAGNSMRLIHGDYEVLLIAQPVAGTQAFGITPSQSLDWLSAIDRSL